MSMKTVQIALTQLALFYSEAAAWAEYGSTADSRRERGYYARRSIKAKAKGLVEHDRILVDARYQ
jgi:hypothetical protein